MKNIWIPVLLALGLVIGTAFHAYAVDGWMKDASGEWHYVEQNGKYAANTWKVSDGERFYLDEHGDMLKDTIIHDKGGEYFLDGSGRMVTSAWYFLDEAKTDKTTGGWMYFGTDGRAVKANTHRFIEEIGDRAYIFSTEGILQTGWLNSKGQPVEDAENPFINGVYYAKEDGAILRGEWLDYGRIGFDDGIGGAELFSEQVQRSYADYERIWFWFREDGRKLRSDSHAAITRNIGGASYQFDENGVMNMSWGSVASISNANRSNPKGAKTADGTSAKTRFFDGSKGGGLKRDAWIWMYPSEQLDAEGYDSKEAAWWHTDENGRVYADVIKKIGEKHYAFDGLGRMQAGFVLFDGKHEYVAQYDVDAWRSQDFIQGSIYGIHRSDLYFFSHDELNDGAMKTGEAIEITIDDGTFTFGFGEDGIAYGSRNTLERAKDAYYINGIRLEADEQLLYGLVKIRDHAGRVGYKVIDRNGKIMEGKRKILRDGEGGYYIISENFCTGYVNDIYKPQLKTIEGRTGYYLYDKDAANPYGRGLATGSRENPRFSDLPDEAIRYVEGGRR